MKALPVALAIFAAVATGVIAPAFAAETEPDIKRVVIEDDQVRIEELRVRGEVQQVLVRNKKSAAPAYQIIVPRGGRDAARDRDANGQRVWQLITF